VFGATLELEGVRTAGSEGSNDHAGAGVSSTVFAVASRVSSWLDGSEDALAAATSPVMISPMAEEEEEDEEIKTDRCSLGISSFSFYFQIF
jgi:hypothetical protein